MKIKYVYYLGCFLLFIGLLWMFLPHAYHQKVLSEEEEIEHLIHIFEGLVIAVVGLFLLIYNERKHRR